MNDLPRTPNTLPSDDEDEFFAFHDDSGENNDSVVVEIGMTKSPEACFLPMYNHVPRKLNFDQCLTRRTQSKNFLNTSSSGNQTVYQIGLGKRKLYSTKMFSTSHLSQKIKNMKLSPVKSSSTLNKFGWQKNDMKIGKKSYQCLEEDETSPIPPKALADDRSSSRHSNPSMFTKPLFWKKLPSTLSSSSSPMTLASKLSKLKWNKRIQMNSVSSFKPYPELSPTSIATTPRAMEVTSSCSTASSSCPSIDEDKRSLYSPTRLESNLHEELDNMRVDEEEDEDYDSDPEETMHPDAGSFACAVSRRCRASFWPA